MNPDFTDFGYERVTRSGKADRVNNVFSSVAARYDLMNDLMSFGVHRLWKRFAVHVSGVRRGHAVLDVAGGTGDCARLFRRAAGPSGGVVICDANAAMLERGRSRLADAGMVEGVEYVLGDAQALPFADQSFDCVHIAFGLRNVTDKPAALASMLRTLKFGGTLVVLEFSRVLLPVLRDLYDRYSLKVIPALGELVTGDRDSYRYLVESIRMHPDQDTLARMLEQAGCSRVRCHNLSGGIVAVHTGIRM